MSSLNKIATLKAIGFAQGYDLNITIKTINKALNYHGYPSLTGAEIEMLKDISKNDEFAKNVVEGMTRGKNGTQAVSDAINDLGGIGGLGDQSSDDNDSNPFGSSWAGFGEDQQDADNPSGLAAATDLANRSVAHSNDFSSQKDTANSSPESSGEDTDTGTPDNDAQEGNYDAGDANDNQACLDGV